MAVTVFGLELIDKKTDRQIASLNDLRPLYQRMGIRLTRKAQRRIEERRKGDVATGNLGNSIRTYADRVGGATFTDLVYAGIQNSTRDRDIYPNPPRKNLAIPMTFTLRKNASWPSDFPRGRFEWRPSKTVAGVLIDTETDELAFILVPKVTIPGRGPFLTIDDEDRLAFRQDVETFLSYDAPTDRSGDLEG